MTTLLLDGDAFVYKLGFISEESYYLVFKDKVLVDTVKKKADVPEGCNSCKVQESSLDVRDTCKMLDRMIDNLKKKLKADDVKMFLTDASILNNDRWILDNTYKQNRSGSMKPMYYANIRNYILERYDTELVTGIEADDALGLNQTKDTIIVSHDKDLLMVPGRHYSLTYNKEILVSDPGRMTLTKDNKLIGVGFKWFCTQLLLGDTADNIRGIKGIGPVKAFKLLDKKKEIKDMWEVVTDAYKDEEDKLKLNMFLLWMARNETHGKDVFKWLKSKGIEV